MQTHLTPPKRKRGLKGIFSRKPSPTPGLPAAHYPQPCENRPTTPTPINPNSLVGKGLKPISSREPSPGPGLPPARAIKKNLKARSMDGDTSSEDDYINSSHTFIDLPTIQCFCTALATYTTIHRLKTPPGCVGRLISTEKHEHRVWALLQQCPKPASLVSLADLITTYTNILDKPSFQSRLVLGLKLISSVLQLNATQWLNERWEAKDILFLVDGEYHRANILSRPFVHRNFSGSSTESQQQPANLAKSVIGCNDSLYSLGIVLIEIWYWQTFSSLYNSSASGQSEWFFSYQLSEKLFEDAEHEAYAQAVRGCIRGFEKRGFDLGDDSFRSKVYQDILGVLEDYLRKSSACDSIQKIIGEE